MRRSLFIAALFSATTIAQQATADASLDELRARLERAEKENLRLKAEKLERENLSMKTQALEQENEKLRADIAKDSVASITATASRAAITAGKKAAHIPSTSIHHRDISKSKSISTTLDAIPKNDPRRELTAKAVAAPLSVEETTPLIKSSWTGIYIGFNAGYGANNINVYNTAVGLGPNISSASTGQNTPIIAGNTTATYFGGPVAGGQIGYNHELINHIMLGAELDFNYADINSNHITNTPVYNYNFTPTTGLISNSTARTGLDWIGTARIRIGYTLGKFLPYVTGGISYGQLTNESSATQASFFNNNISNFSFSTGTNFSSTGNSSSVNFGWAAGAGAEYLVADNWSVKGEYLFTQLSGLGGQTNAVQALYSSGTNATSVNSGGPLFNYGTMSAFGIHQARIGLNYHSDWLPYKSTVTSSY